MNNRKLSLGVIAVLFAMAGGANAQIRPSYQFPAEPEKKGPVQLGDSPFFLAPLAGLAIGRDDNLFLANTNKKASTSMVLSPGFSMDARGGSSVFQLKYQALIGRFGQSDDDNYVDHTSGAKFDFALDRRNFLRVGLDYVRLHDPRGSTDRPVAGRPDIYTIATPAATYAFGAPGADGRVEVYASDAVKRYKNNRATTAASDRDNQELGGAFYWRVAPKTYVLAEARSTDISYKVSSPSSGQERRYYGGVSWEASAATTGTLKAGQFERKFDVGGKDTASSWEGIVSWSPLSYSKFDFFTSRQTNESTGAGRFILSSIGGVSWNHAWNSLFSTGVDLKYSRDNYRGFDRKDEIKNVGLKAGYKFRPWLTLGAEYTHTTRDSNSTVNEYDKNLYLLTATASM